MVNKGKGVRYPVMERNLALAASTRCSARTTYRRTVPSTSVGRDEPVLPQHARREREGGNGRSPAWAPAAGRGRPPPGRAPGRAASLGRISGVPHAAAEPRARALAAGGSEPHASWGELRTLDRRCRGRREVAARLLGAGEMRPAEPVPIASHVLCPVSCGQAWGCGRAGGAAADCRGGRPLCSGCSLPRPPQTLGSHHAAACCEPRGVVTQAHAMGRGAPRGRDTVLSDHVQAMLQLPVTGKNLPLAKVLPGRASPKSGQCPAAPSPPASGWGVGGRGVGRGLGQGRGPLGLGRLAPRLWPRPLVAAPLFIFTKSMRPESRPPRPTLHSPGFQSW